MNKTPAPPVDFLIVTALEEERNAVLSRLPDYQQLPPGEDVRVYYAAVVEATLSDGRKCQYSVAVCMVGMGRVPATAATGDAIRRWLPDYVLLVGIAGALKSANVDLGDILIADQIADYSSQKRTTKGTEIRWTAQPVDERLLNFSKSMRDSDWHSEIQVDRPHFDPDLPKRHTGTVTTGDSVIADNALLESFKNLHWPKLIGVEMEAGGCAEAARQSGQRPGFFMVRCVSDQAGNKGNKKVKAWRPYACDAAAAFALTMIRNGPIQPKRMLPPAPGQPDVLAQEMAKLTFAHLEIVTGYVLGQPAQAGADFTQLAPSEKMKRNGLGERTRAQLVIGLSKASLVREYVDHVATLDQTFPEKLKAGFLAAYNRLAAAGLLGDELFDRLADFSCKNSHDIPYRAAGLAVLTYLFEICDVFEK